MTQTSVSILATVQIQMTIKPVASSLLPSTLIDIIENRVAMVKNKKWRIYEKQALHVPEPPSPPGHPLPLRVVRVAVLIFPVVPFPTSLHPSFNV